MKIDWKRKLTSRKFWVAVTGFISQLMVAFGAADGTVTQVAAVIMAGATVIAYVLAEGFVDSSSYVNAIGLTGERVKVEPKNSGEEKNCD